MDKPVLKYAVRLTNKFGTSEIVRSPYLVEGNQIGLETAVANAIDAGYIRGQLQDMIGVITGFFGYITKTVKGGQAVSLRSWVRFGPSLRGTVGEDYTLGSNNELVMVATPLDEMKQGISMDAFSFKYAGIEVDKPTISHVLPVGGSEKNVIVKNKNFIVYGSNLEFDAQAGDTMKVSYEGLGTPLSITPTENDISHQKYDFPTALAEVDDGTILTLTLSKTFGSGEESVTVTTTKYVTYKVA